MNRFVAFLRAINVGGHRVKMSQLAELFESFDLLDVETFIASGNVIFESEDGNNEALEMTIASGLQEALGYEVSTFIRSLDNLASIVNYEAFPQQSSDKSGDLNVAFLTEPLSEEQTKSLIAFETDIDAFVSHGREIHWRCSVKQSQSTFSNTKLERSLGIRTTFRSMNTLRRIVAKYAK